LAEALRRRSQKMIPYMDLNEQMNPNEQVDSDFSRARRRALLRRVLAHLRGKPASNRLLSFDDVRGAFRANNSTYLGTRVVEVEKIVGGVGERWKRIDRAFHRGEDLPPIELYRIGEAYFVVDGHHRVSVARYHGAKWIDARVIEVGSPVSEKPRLRPESREHRVARQERSRSKARKEPAQKRPALRLSKQRNRSGEEVVSLGILKR
jgi:hypothetical protein